MKGLALFACALALCALCLLPAAPAVACDYAQQLNAGGSCYAQNFRAQQQAAHYGGQNQRSQQQANHHHGQNARAQQQADQYGGQDFRAGFNAGRHAQQNAGPQRVTTRTRRGLLGGSVTTTVTR